MNRWSEENGTEPHKSSAQGIKAERLKGRNSPHNQERRIRWFFLTELFSSRVRNTLQKTMNHINYAGILRQICEAWLIFAS